MDKGKFQLTKNQETYCLTLPDKKYLKEIFHTLYDDISGLSFYISNYSGTNTYFGDNYWEKHGIDFRKGEKSRSYIFKGDTINFIIKDKIESVNIAVCKGVDPERDNISEVIKLKPDTSLSIYTTDFSLICKCLVFHVQFPLFLDFSKRYAENEFLEFIKTFIPKDFNGQGQIYYKSLRIKKGFTFKVSLEEKNKERVFYTLGYKNEKWFSEKIVKEKDNVKLENLKKLEKINYFYVSIFFLVVVSGLLLIATKLRFNIVIFMFIGVLFFSCLIYIYKKVKIIFGFKMALKNK